MYIIKYSMKTVNHQHIAIPLEFNVACTIYKLSVVEVLQVFINHVKLYNLIDKTYDEGFSEAIHAIIFYVRAKEQRCRSKAINKCEDTFNNCFHQLYTIAEPKNSELLMVKKREYAEHAIATIFEAIERPYTSSDKIYLDEYSYLKLSPDFCILCEIYNCYPKEYLEYFMGSISLADAHAHKGLKLRYNNFVFDFFKKIATGFGRDSPSVHELSEEELDFYDLMAELPLKLYHIRGVEERFLLLQKVYHLHYKTMNKH